MTHVVEFDNVRNGDIVRLEYQHTFNRRTPDFNTTTTEQRPDIVVTITKKNGFILTYLYDAKYRVLDDRTDVNIDEGADIDIADYPLPDAINQMHRYRDAIYYALKEDVRPQGKEIIGGYILFPGRVEGDSIYERYFYKSIEKVNIGAFPLLPSNADTTGDLIQCYLLEEHLRHILLENSIAEHIKDSIPQKGLYYTDTRPKAVQEKNVYLGYVGLRDDNLEDFETCSAKYYKLQKIPKGINMLDTKFLAPMVKGKVYGSYIVTGVTIDNGYLVLQLGDYTPFGNAKANFFEKIKPTELLSMEHVVLLYSMLTQGVADLNKK